MRVSENVAFGLQRAPRRPRPDRASASRNRCASSACRSMSSAFRANCPAASSSASRSRARSRSVRACCCWTSRCRRSTRRSAARWSRSSPGCIADLPDLTILYVTHDQSEALTLADRIAILQGRRTERDRPHRRALSPPAQSLRRRVPRPRQPVAGGGRGKAQDSGFVGVRSATPRSSSRRRTSRRRRAALLCVRPQNLTLTGDAERSNSIEADGARDPLAGRTDPPRRRDRRADPARRGDAAAEPARTRRPAVALLLACATPT